MSVDNAAPESRGVTVEPLASIDLGPEIEGLAGRQLRMRLVTMEPGAVFGPEHDHRDRPGLVYVLQGTITDHATVRPPSTGRDSAGPKIGTRCTGWRTGAPWLP